MKRLLFLSIPFLVLACSPRDPQVLTNDQKLSNLCFKNKTLDVCQQQAQDKEKLVKPFVAKDTDLNYAMYALDRQSEVFRLLRAALNFEDSKKSWRLQEKCASAVSYSEPEQSFLKVSLNACPTATTPGNSIVTSGDLIFSFKYEKGQQLKEILISSENRQITVSKKATQQQQSKQSVLTATINEKILVKARVMNREADGSLNLFLETLEVSDQVTGKNTVGIDESTQLRVSSGGTLWVLMQENSKNLFQSFMPRLQLSFDSSFTSDTKARSYFSLILNNKNESPSSVESIETSDNACSTRALAYSVDYKFTPALSYENGTLVWKDSQLSITNTSQKTRSIAEEACIATADNVLTKTVPWNRYLFL